MSSGIPSRRELTSGCCFSGGEFKARGDPVEGDVAEEGVPPDSCIFVQVVISYSQSFEVGPGNEELTNRRKDFTKLRTRARAIYDLFFFLVGKG